MDKLVGGWSETKDATEEIQSICDEVKCQVEEKTNKKHGIYKAVKYRSQLVAGMNYLIKVINILIFFIFLKTEKKVSYI
ncbi:stefin-C-like, partial [Larimichthys crocea]|uniref:stefin-C-like n=1 Tax=Larimichthys crocea TaxID=215358 RepID=UPI000F5F00CA